MNLRPSGYEPDELPGCSIPRCLFCLFCLEIIWVLIRFGGALLSHTLRCSTIGATALNFRVREGTGCFACALATKPNKNPKLNSRSEFRRWPEAICRRQIAWPHLSYVTEHVCSASFQYHQPVDPFRRVNVLSKSVLLFGVWLSFTGSDQANRAISTGQLNALLRLHLRPIDVVVFHGPQGYLVLRGASRLDAFSGYPVRS